MKLEIKKEEEIKIECGDILVTDRGAFMITMNDPFSADANNTLYNVINMNTGITDNHFWNVKKIGLHYNITKVIKNKNLLIKEL